MQRDDAGDAMTTMTRSKATDKVDLWRGRVAQVAAEDAISLIPDRINEFCPGSSSCEPRHLTEDPGSLGEPLLQIIESPKGIGAEETGRGDVPEVNRSTPQGLSVVPAQLFRF